MNIVDIRDVLSSKNIDLLEITTDYIYYTEEKFEEGHNNLFFLKYDRDTKEETVIANYSLANPTFVQHIYTFPKSIILLLENGGPDVWLVKIQKSTGKELKAAKLETYGPFDSCYALDEKYIVIYTKRSENDKASLERYKKFSIEPKFMHIYDIDEQTSFRVLDERICRLKDNSIITYIDIKGEKQALILSPFGDESFKEQCYKKSNWLDEQLFDKIWLCPFEKFISDIKRSTNKISLMCLASANNEGSVRFTGMDDNNIYFRTKSFINSKEEIIACNKTTLEKNHILTLVYDAPKTYYHINSDNAKIYKLSESHGVCDVEGVVDSCINTKYSSLLGDFIGCIDERFIITKKIITDKDGNYTFEYNYVIDSKNNIHEGFECKAAIKDDTLVLY